MAKSLIRKNQLHPDIADLISGYGDNFFITQEELAAFLGNYLITGQNIVLTTGNQNITGIKNFYDRLTVNGSGVLLNGEQVDLSSTVRITGNQNISGSKNFYTRPQVNGTGILLSGEITQPLEQIIWMYTGDPYSSLILNPITTLPGKGTLFYPKQDTTRPSVFPYPNYHYTGINNSGTEIYFNTGEMRWFFNYQNTFIAKSPVTSSLGPFSFSAYLPLTEWVYSNNTPISGFKFDILPKHSISHAKTGTDPLALDSIGAVSLDSEQIISGQKYFIGNSFLKTGSFFQDNIGISQLYSGANPLNRFIYTGWSPSGLYIKLNKGSFVNVRVTGIFGGYFVRWFSSNNVNGPYNYFNLSSGSTLTGRLSASGLVSGYLPINDNLLFFEGTPNGGGNLNIRVSGDYGYYSGNKFGFGNLEPVADFDFIGSTKIDGNLHLTQRPTVNNSVLLISGDPNIVYTTGNQTIQGVKNFGTRPTFYFDPFVLSTELSSATINTVKTTGTQYITGDKIFKNSVYFLSDGSFIKQSSFYQALGVNSFNQGFSTIPIPAQYNYTGWRFNNNYIELSRGSQITIILSGAGAGWGVRWYSSTGVNGPWTNFTLYSGVGNTPVTGITILGTNSVQTATGFLRRDHKYLAFNAGAGGGGSIYLTVSGDYGYYSGNKFGFGTENPDELFHVIGTTKIEGPLLITGKRPTVNGSGVLLQGEAVSGLKWGSVFYDNQFGGASDGFAGRASAGQLILYGTGQQTAVPSFYGWNGFFNDSFTAATARTNLGLTSTATQPENTFIRTTGVNNYGWNKIQKLTGAGTGNPSMYGNSLDMNSDGSILFMGGKEETFPGAANVGGLLIYTGTPSIGWNLKQKLTGDSDSDRFGSVVATNNNGNILLVSASFDSISGRNGSISVYTGNSSNGWQFRSKLTGDSVSSFGESLDINHNGDIIIIGSSWDDTFSINAGAAFIYTGNAVNGWSLKQKILGDGFESRLGQSVAINGNGNILAMTSDVNSGSLHIYTGNAINGWSLKQKITGDSLFDLYGSSMDINNSGNILLVGARGDDSNGGDAGATFIYTGNAVNGWSLRQKLTGDSAGDQFGISVSCDDNGTNIVIGAPFDDIGNADAGAAFFYTGNAINGWQLKEKLIGTGIVSYFGNRVSINNNGSILIIGDIGDDEAGTNFGASFVYSLQNESFELNSPLNSNFLYVRGQSAFDGNVNFDTRPQVNGTGILLQGEAAAGSLIDVIYTTGDQTVSGKKTFVTEIISPNLVYLTGNQTISGTKIFSTGNGAYLKSEFIYTNSPSVLKLSDSPSNTSQLPLNILYLNSVSPFETASSNANTTGIKIYWSFTNDNQKELSRHIRTQSVSFQTGFSPIFGPWTTVAENVQNSTGIIISGNTNISTRAFLNNYPLEDRLRHIETSGIFSLLSGERVGIGTHVPEEKLHVVGDLKLDGSLKITNNIICGKPSGTQDFGLSILISDQSGDKVSFIRGGSVPLLHSYGIVFEGGDAANKKGYLTVGPVTVANSYNYASLDWTNRILSGNWISSSPIRVGNSIPVMTSGTQEVSGTKTFITNSILYSGVNVNFDAFTNVRFSGQVSFNNDRSWTTGISPGSSSYIIPYSGGIFSSTPRVLTTLEVTGSTVFNHNIKNRTTSQFTLMFPSALTENVILNIRATL